MSNVRSGAAASMLGAHQRSFRMHHVALPAARVGRPNVPGHLLKALTPRHEELVNSRGDRQLGEHVLDFQVDARYQRVDMADMHAFSARQAFARNIAAGEGGIRLADAALLVAAEDDAIASHSTVPFPVASFSGRIQRFADELAELRLPPELRGAGPEAASEVLRVVEQYLLQEKGFRMLPSGRSALAKRMVVDNPGVWEDARGAYLNELLVRRVGHPAALAILVADVMRRLLQLGAVDFAVRMDCRGFQEAPQAVPLPGLRRSNLVGKEGQMVNTCTSEALVELLRLLKRAYWPHPWDTGVDDPDEGGRASHGGFRGAAKAALGQDVSAEARAIATVAAHRLERGIWTSPGGGDLRRAVAACERLVMLLDDPLERRDLAVLLFHSGQLSRARAELAAYVSSSHYTDAADPFDAAFVDRLMHLLDSMPGLDPEERVTSVESVLAMPPPAPELLPKVPLTW